MARTIRIGGYAVIQHGGDELSDWEHIKAVLPTKATATTYARKHIGARSLRQKPLSNNAG